MEMLYSTGIRVSELVNIKLKDINEIEKKIIILGKGNKERYVYYGKQCENLLNIYMNERKQIKTEEEYLFLNKHGKKINDRKT